MHAITFTVELVEVFLINLYFKIVCMIYNLFSKPLNYAIAAGECNPELFHSYVGMEPSERYFNELCLDHESE